MSRAYLSLFLALVHAAAGLGILIISTWFIAISAIAPVGFNYVIPAVVIRALALLRIAAGYATKWLGHDDLLTRTATTRLALFSTLKDKNLEQKAWLTEALANHAQRIASAWIAWATPFASAVVLNAVAIVASSWLLLPGRHYLWLLAAAWAGLVIWLCVNGVRLATKQVCEEQRFRETSDEFIRTSSLWHLLPSFREPGTQTALPSATRVWRAGSRRDMKTLVAAWIFQGAAFVLVLWGLSAQSASVLHSPLAIVVPMLLLAAPDWLGNSLAAGQAFADDRVSRHALKQITTQSQPLLGSHAPVSYIALTRFQAKERHVVPVSVHLPAKGIVMLQGSSGCGKSSLLQAIAGLLPHQGVRQVDNIQLLHGLPQGWVYVEQQPVILNGTLKHNLDPAGTGIGEERMHTLLTQLDLQALLPLKTWLGTGGRALSGGEAKRLALARAILACPDVLLVDEPFEGLDDASQNRVSTILNELADKQLMVLASHVQPGGLAVEQYIDMDSNVDNTAPGEGIYANARELC